MIGRGTRTTISGWRFLGECIALATALSLAAWLGCGCTPAQKEAAMRVLLSGAELAIKIAAAAAGHETSGGEEP